MSFLLTILFLCLALNNLSEAKHGKNLPSAVVVGTVYCDTCFQEKLSKPTHFISGASVAVECGGTSSRPSFYKEVKTNAHGEFEVSLPFSVTKHVKTIERCSVKLINSNEPYCSVASTATSSSLHLKSRKQGIHIFSAGFFTFRPLKQPELCTQKPSFKNTKEFNSSQSSVPLVPKKKRNSKNTNSIKTTQKRDQQEISYPVQQIPLFPPIIPIPLPPNPLQPPSILPPNPFLPPPSILPPNPLLPPPSIFPPNPFQPSPPSILPPNPLLPPPSIFPPNPFQPPPSPPSIFPPNPFQPPLSPPSIFPPNPFQPSPPSPGIHLPPIPFLTPSPPPPPPPVFPVPFPPIHLPPFPLPPGFPGIPPASSSVKSSP